ncbi:MAG: DUF2851 family protein [Dehalococcoidia bacterium]
MMASVAEQRPAYRPAAPDGALTESQLTAIWHGRRFPTGALVTRGGVPVQVIFQGRAGRGPGPDFRGAVIAGPSGLPLRGDVELHVRSSSFKQHGHEDDPAYVNVILHVVFEDDTGVDTPLPGGKTAPVIALAPWVARRAEDLQRWLATPVLWREPCHDAVMRLGEDGVRAALAGEGDRRLEVKAARAAETVRRHGVDQALYEGILEAMGYGGNAAPMLALARVLPWPLLDALTRSSHDRRLHMEALLLGVAGLLPSQRRHACPVAPHVGQLERAFEAAELASLGSERWKLWGVRPENMPARRIAGCAALLAHHGAPSRLLNVLEARTVNEAVRPFAVAASGYWRGCYDTCAAPVRLGNTFIGRSRALEIIINVVLPVAAASGDPAQAAKARALYEKLPRPSAYGVTRFIETALASEGVRVRVDARGAQGMLALHRDWCTANGCGRCPLS